MDMVHIEGSTVVVTGGQRGLGKAIVAELLERGAAKVYATARAPKPNEDPRVVSVALALPDADRAGVRADPGPQRGRSPRRHPFGVFLGRWLGGIRRLQGGVLVSNQLPA